MERKEISRNYKRLSAEMEMVHLSLDKNRDYWKTATKEDEIVWNNVSDMEVANGRIKTIYNVQAIPTSFLIDKRGVIIGKFVGYDDTSMIKEIEDKIKNAKENEIAK